MNHSTKGDIVVPTNLAQNVTELHKFLFGEENYQVSDEVQRRSDTIEGIVGGTISDSSAAAAEPASETYTDDGAYTDSGYDNTYTEDTSDYTDYSQDYSGGYEDDYSDYSGDTYEDNTYTDDTYTGDTGTGGEDYSGGYEDSGMGDAGGDVPVDDGSYE